MKVYFSHRTWTGSGWKALKILGFLEYPGSIFRKFQLNSRNNLAVTLLAFWLRCPQS